MSTAPPPPELVFWPGSLYGAGYDELLVAAAAGGYRQLAVSPAMIDGLLRAGVSAAGITRRAADAGVALSHLDGASSWAPLWFEADPPE